MSFFKQNADGHKTWNTSDVKEYHVTGVTAYSNKRFKIVCLTWRHAGGVNLWRGSKWAVDHNGKRHLIQRVYN